MKPQQGWAAPMWIPPQSGCVCCRAQRAHMLLARCHSGESYFKLRFRTCSAKTKPKVFFGQSVRLYRFRTEGSV
eukprot:4181116-Prymnesium_polylepis.1